MAFLLIPLVLGGGALLLSGCGSSSPSRDVPADGANPSPNPSGSAYVGPAPTGSALIAPPPARTSPIATMLATPPEPMNAGTPGAEELRRYPGDNDEARARNWALNRGVERYFGELRRLVPGLAARDAVSSVLTMIQTNASTSPIRVTYTFNNVTQTISLDHPTEVFLRRLISDDVAGLRTFLHRENQPDLPDQTIRELKTAATDLLREAGGGGNGGDGGNPRGTETGPRPSGSASPRPNGSAHPGGNHGSPTPRRPTGGDIL